MAALVGLHDAHDRLFKYVFGAPAAMAVLLRRMLHLAVEHRSTPDPGAPLRFKTSHLPATTSVLY